MDNDDASMLRAAAEERRLRSSFVERTPPAPPADDAVAELNRATSVSEASEVAGAAAAAAAAAGAPGDARATDEEANFETDAKDTDEDGASEDDGRGQHRPERGLEPLLRLRLPQVLPGRARVLDMRWRAGTQLLGRGAQTRRRYRF